MSRSKETVLRPAKQTTTIDKVTAASDALFDAQAIVRVAMDAVEYGQDAGADAHSIYRALSVADGLLERAGSTLGSIPWSDRPA